MTKREERAREESLDPLSDAIGPEVFEPPLVVADRRVEGRKPAPAWTVPGLLPRVVSRTLWTGMLVAGGLLVVGLALLAVQGANSLANFSFQGTSFGLSSFANGLLHGSANSVLLLGFLVLILTPLIQVAASAVLFLNDRDRPFAALTLAVLVVVAVSFAVGLHA